MATRVEKMSRYCGDMLKHFLSYSINGNCYNLAIALHRGLGWPIVGLVENGNIIHAGVRSPKGEIWDGRGKITEMEFGSYFSDSHLLALREVSERELLDTGTVSEYMVNTYREKAELLWSDLPWKGETIWKRIETFTDELEVISRKHKFWICAPIFTNPATFPVIFEGHDDEAGYEVRLSDGSNAFTINRRLK